MGKKPLIFYCDDKLKWTKQFKRRHRRSFEIWTTGDAMKFQGLLKAMVKRGKTPDIILIDLYHPHHPPKSKEQKGLDDIGSAAIKQLDKDLEEAKKAIVMAGDPSGFVMLEQARVLCPKTPIAIYTEQGLMLAGEGELKKASENNGEWFLKGKSAFYEACRLEKMLPKRALKNKKPLIFYCDSNIKLTEQFKQRHQRNFDIQTTNDAMEFQSGLRAMINRGEAPDIILIDLYHPIHDPNSDEQKLLDKAAKEAIEKLNDDIRKAKGLITTAWKPYGYEMLEQARALCPDTPIAIYTEQGLTLAGAEELERVSRSKGEWFLKGKSAFYENCRLKSMIPDITIPPPIIIAWWLVFSAIVFVVALVYSLLAEEKLVNTVSFVATMVALVLAIVQFVDSYIVNKPTKPK